MEVVGVSVDPGFFGVFKAATPTIATPITMTMSAKMWWMYCFLPRNYQARKAVMITIAPLII